MKSIKELELLVNFTKSLGQTPDPEMVARIREHYELQKKIIDSVKANSAKDIKEAFSISTTKENKNELVQENTESERTPETASTSYQPNLTEDIERNEEESDAGDSDRREPSGQTLADLAAKFISEAPKVDSFQQPKPVLPQIEINALARKLQNLESWLAKVSAAGPGSGEVNLRYLDDVDRPNIADDLYLRYESNLGKFTFDKGHKNNFHISVQSNVTQYLNAGNVASFVTYNAVDFQSKFRLESNSRIVTEQPGRYNLQYSIQLENAGASTESVNIWLVQNGQTVARTNSKYDVLGKHAGANGAIIAAINYFYETSVANEYVELAWWATHNDVFLSTIPPLVQINGVQPEIPETPTAIVTVSPVKVDSY